MFHSGSSRGPSSDYGDSTGSIIGRIELPNLRVAIKDNDATVVRNAGPYRAATGEVGQRPWLATRLGQPNVFGAASIRDVIDTPAVFVPHRPNFFGAAFTYSFVTWCGAEAKEPDFTLIDVTMSFAPPLRLAKTMSA